MAGNCNKVNEIFTDCRQCQEENKARDVSECQGNEWQEETAALKGACGAPWAGLGEMQGQVQAESQGSSLLQGPGYR